MAGNYELWLTSDSGVRLAPLDTALSLECSRVVNEIGSFGMYLPLSFNPDLLQPDRLIQVWRQPEGGRLGLWRVYMLREWEFSTQGSDQMLEISGPDMLDLMRRRIVAAYAGSAQASKTDYADDMMKEVVTQSIANGVAPTPTAGTRVWANLSIAADLSDGPIITRSFPFETLLTGSSNGVLAQLAKAAREAGTEVFFDIIPNVVSSNSITFQFQTFTGQPGQDVSDRVTFDQADGNMKEPKLRYNYRDEVNYVYATGPGEESDRNVQQVYDATRYGQSIWGRCEVEADARNQPDDNNAIQAVGNDRLSEGRPRVSFTAQPVDTEGTRFGIDWDFGYQVGAKYLNRQFKTIIRAVTISLREGQEEIRARLDYEGAV
jgi:hypothetical protein